MVVQTQRPGRPTNAGLRMGLGTALVLALLCTIPLAAQAEWFLERLLDEGWGASLLSANHTDCIVADDSGNVHVVWMRPWRRHTEIYYARFDGSAWMRPDYVGGDLVRNADLAVGHDGGVHVVSSENWTHVCGEECTEMFCWKLGAPSWEYPVYVGHAADSSVTACAAAGKDGAPHFVWRDKMYDGYNLLFHETLLSSGGVHLEIAVASVDSVGAASLAGNGDGNLHLVWCDRRHGNWEIYYKRFDGTAWGPGERLTESPGTSLEPSIAVGADGSVHTVWVDQDGTDFDVFHRVHDGIAWGPTEGVSNSPGSAHSPRVAVDREGRTHVVWVDDRDGGREVYYAVKSGASWSQAEQVTDIGGSAGNPGVAVDTAGIVHVVWHDNRDGKNRVYWKALYPGEVPLPELQTVEPGDAFSGDMIDSLRIFGSGFVPPASAWMQKRGETPVRFDGVRVVSPNEIVCSVDLLRVHHGDWDVIVENPNGSRDTLRAGFEIVPFARPLAASIEPRSMESNLGLHVRELVGGNFVSPVSVWLDRAGEQRLIALDTKVRSVDTLEFTMSLDGAVPGVWNVVVENPDGRSDTIAGGFEVLPASWSEDVRLTDDPGGSMTGYTHSRTVAVDPDGRVYVVWYDNRSGNYGIYYKVLDKGVWSTDVKLTSDSWVSSHPAIATGPDGRVHIVWQDRRHGYDAAIYYKEHTGSGWGPDELISTPNAVATKPSIAVDETGDVHVVWCEVHGGWQVIYRKRAGGEWQEEVALTETPGSHAFPSIAVDDVDVVHIVWQGNFGTSGGSQIYYSWHDDEGWQAPLRLSFAGDECLAPSVATGPGGRAHFVWHDACGEDLCEIYYTAWDRKTWHPQEAITSAPGASRNACVAVDDTGGVHVVWQDDRDQSQEMYYKSYDGRTWSADVRLNATQSLSRKPSVTVDSRGRIHVIWHDDRDGNWEIYYKSRAVCTSVSRPPKWVVVKRIAPNPTLGPCTVFAEVDGVGRVTVEVYDVTGRHIWEGIRTTAVPGLIGLTWNGRGRDGRLVAPGVYFLRVNAFHGTASGKVVVVR